MTEKTQPRDYSEVINRITNTAIVLLTNGDGFTYTLERNECFKEKALAILQEFDAQNQPDLRDKTHSNCCRGCQYEIDMLIEEIATFFRMEEKGMSFDAYVNLRKYLEKNYRKQWEKYMGNEDETAPTEESIEWVVGGRYEDSTGKIFVFIGLNPVHDNDSPSKAIFTNERGVLCFRYQSGKIAGYERRFDIIKKHTTKPVEREINMWVNVYPDLEVYEPCCYFSREEADEYADATRVACLHIKQKFVEGEGL